MRRVIRLQRVSAWVFLGTLLLHAHLPVGVATWLTALVALSGIVHVAAGIWIGSLDVARSARGASLAVGGALVAMLALVGASTLAQKPGPADQPQHQQANAGRCSACHPGAAEPPLFTGALTGANVHGTMACQTCHAQADGKASCRMCHPRDSHGEVWALMPERPFLTGEGVHFLTCTSCHADKAEKKD